MKELQRERDSLIEESDRLRTEKQQADEYIIARVY